MCIEQSLSPSNSSHHDQDSVLIKSEDPYLADTDAEETLYVGITMDPDATSVGFVELPRGNNITIGALRRVIQSETNLPPFEFMLPSGYPVSSIQERKWNFKKFGAKGDGSFVNPYKIHVREATTAGIKKG